MVRLQLDIADTGPGVPPHLRESIFEPFVQGDAHLMRSQPGAGLGLAIARRLAEAMRARLTLECPPGGGSVFSLALELPAAPAEVDSPAQRARPESTGGRAWLVYANADSARWMSQRLARLGWECQVSPSAAQALSLARMPGQARPDLVLVAESALADIHNLAELREGLPGAWLRLLVNPLWQRPELESQAAALGIPILVAPFTPAQLARLTGDLQPEPADTEPIDKAPEPGPGVQATVLLVEDNAVNQLVLQEFLQALGLHVRVANSGASAIAACLAQPPQLVLMDLELPDFDGLEATRRLIEMQRQGAWPGAPIVALTAHATAADRAACRAAGMAAMLTKPMSQAMLRKRLARWLAV